MAGGPPGGAAGGSAPSRDARRPPWRKLLREAPAAVRLLLAQLRKPPFADPSAGGGRPVLVLPAFLANDIPTALLRRTLDANGFRAFGWENGLNLGARRDTLERLGKRLDEVIEAAGSPVAVIGWSLGGLYARELAKRRPQDVSLVITLGTPFSVDLRRNNAWKLYELINDHPVDDPPLPVEVDVKPPVRTIAVWSQRDGIVAPASAQGAAGEVDERIEVRCTHNEMVSDPEPLALIVSLLKTRFAGA
jgi:pimeloyl-ACP methyl ester carboxylesterase